MGFPFPTAIRLLKLEKKELIPWAWSVNAFATVVSSILAQMIATSGGYNLVFILAGGCYLLSFPFFRFSDHRDKAHA